MYNCEAVVRVSARASECVRMHVNSRECTRETREGREGRTAIYASWSVVETATRNRPTCLGHCWAVATGRTVFVPGMKRVGWVMRALISEEIGEIGADAPMNAEEETVGGKGEESENYPSVSDIDCREGAQREVNRG